MLLSFLGSIEQPYYLVKRGTLTAVGEALSQLVAFNCSAEGRDNEAALPLQGVLQRGNATKEYTTNTEGSAKHSSIVVTTMRQALEYPMSSDSAPDLQTYPYGG